MKATLQSHLYDDCYPSREKLSLCCCCIKYDKRCNKQPATRGVGTRGPSPPSFAKCPGGSKVPFSCVKNVMKIAFFAQRELLKTWIYVISGKIFSFPGKISYPENFLVYPEKTWYIHQIFLVCPENFFMRWSRRQHFREKFLDAFFFEKCPSKPGPTTFRSFLRPWLQHMYSIHKLPVLSITLLHLSTYCE